jgi:hypothetical protein
VNNQSSQLRLSGLDQVLLDHLGTDAWVRPHHFLQDRRFFEEFLFLIGDESLLARLHAWAVHNPTDPVLLARQVAGASDWTNRAYRLTPLGERLRRHGLDSPHQAPPLFVGGCRVYTGTNPWVRRTNGHDWRIERLDPGGQART